MWLAGLPSRAERLAVPAAAGRKKWRRAIGRSKPSLSLSPPPSSNDGVLCGTGCTGPRYVRHLLCSINTPPMNTVFPLPPPRLSSSRCCLDIFDRSTMGDDRSSDGALAVFILSKRDSDRAIPCLRTPRSSCTVATHGQPRLPYAIFRSLRHHHWSTRSSSTFSNEAEDARHATASGSASPSDLFTAGLVTRRTGSHTLRRDLCI